MPDDNAHTVRSYSSDEDGNADLEFNGDERGPDGVSRVDSESQIGFQAFLFAVDDARTQPVTKSDPDYMTKMKRVYMSGMVRAQSVRGDTPMPLDSTLGSRSFVAIASNGSTEHSVFRRIFFG